MPDRNALQAVQAINEERRFQLLVDGVTDYALYMIDPEGHVATWNSGAQRLKGYMAGEIMGVHFSRFYTDEERAAGVPDRALATAAREGRYETEGWRIRKDGTRFWAAAVLDAIRDENGTLLGFAKITRDITERRNAQAALQRTQEQLAQAQKMEALGQLTGGIAHDFNNLLMIVSGHSQLLRRRLDDPKDVRALDAIQLAASRGERLTRQLLSFSRRQDLSPVTIDLRNHIEALNEMLVGSVHGNVRLVSAVPPDVWSVKVDVDELELAIVNMAVNARDAMPNGGAITISAENVALEAGLETDGLQGEFVALRVTDTGTGIPPEFLTKVFEPFFTTKQVDRGTGLGLSQVYGFAHQSGGTVTLESEVGRGTTVTIYLPRSHAPLSDLTRSEPPTEGEQAAGTILIVEDNAEVGQVTAAMVEQLGYTAITVQDASAALDALRGSAKIDLVLTDIVMPGPMDGYKLARVLRAQYPELPLLLTSGYNRAAQTAENEFPLLRKPYQVATLAASVRETIVKHHAARRQNQAPNRDDDRKPG